MTDCVSHGYIMARGFVARGKEALTLGGRLNDWRRRIGRRARGARGGAIAQLRARYGNATITISNTVAAFFIPAERTIRRAPDTLVSIELDRMVLITRRVVLATLRQGVVWC
ncbi:hypothetical protein [Sphaerisporangium fuscum]|uniref:hypothetical protein n=1 Tax=Sphaerisporangium fuscum TaxID=2835868 RepID=UPI001BDC043B|nr:hypothetical protein [Sphaerisporangium fuscum]